MAILFKDRVKDTSTTTGTGNLTIANSAPSGFITFNTAFGTGTSNQFYYVIDNGSEWEVGIGYLSSSTVLVRQTVLASTNAGAAVNFSAGTKDVFSDVPATPFMQGNVRVLSSTLVNLNSIAVTDLFVVPTGFKAVVLQIVLHTFSTTVENFASMNVKWSGGDDVISAITFGDTPAGSTSTFLTHVGNTANAESIFMYRRPNGGAAGDTLQADVSAAEGSAATCVVDAVGYLLAV